MMSNAIAIIPARGGSKRLPGKNIKMFHGRPILTYSIEVAQNAGIFAGVIVSTDSEEIAEVARRAGATTVFRREELAGDDVETWPVINDVLKHWPFADLVCCIYPCAPMLDAQTLRDAYYRLRTDPIISYVVPVGTWLRDPGQFYFGKASSYKCGVPLISRYTSLIEIDPATDCDINTPEDFERAELMYSNLKGIK